MKNNKIILIIGGILLIVVFSVIIFWVIKNEEEDKNSDKDKNTEEPVRENEINETALKTKDENWKLYWELPSDTWKLETQDSEANNRGMYKYVKEIDNCSDNDCEPIVAIMFEKLEASVDPIVYSSMVRARGPFFEVEKVITEKDDDFNIDYAIGYKGFYKDNLDEKHDILVLHAVTDDIGVVVIMDATNEIYPNVEEEFRSILKSIKRLE